MIEIEEGEKEDIIVAVTRKRGSGAVPVTSPQRRILNAAKTVVSGFDWAAASWDATAGDLYALFDSTLTGLTAVGTYYMQLRCTIGSELYRMTVRVDVVEAGP